MNWKPQAAAFTILLGATIFICIEIGLKPSVTVLPSQQFNWANFASLLNGTTPQTTRIPQSHSQYFPPSSPDPPPQIPNRRPRKPRKDYDYTFAVSYDNWIRGIGDNYLWNNETNSTCLYPRVPYKMDTVQAINTDILYNHKHYCESANSFSKIYDRVITVHCPPSAPLKYAEWIDIFHGQPPTFNSTDWKSISENESVATVIRNQKTLLVYTIELQETSQTSWVSCNNQHQYHFALLSLQQRNATAYKQKSETIKRNFDRVVPPNVVIFITDSTARANFFRGASSTVEYLSNLQLNTEGQSRTDVLEFFRYSTVGWGTGQNLLGLAGGGCTLCKVHPFREKCIGLAEYYDSLGYESLGYTYYINNREGNRFPWQSGEMGEDNNCDYYISQNVLPKPCKYGNDVYWAKEYALQAIRLQRSMDRQVPYFIIIHNQANHVTSGKLMFQFDMWTRELVEYMDKENTILHLVADHGSLVGGSMSNMYGQWEMRNPVSILMLPKWLNNSLHFLGTMKVNQQRHTNHYDMHYFFKQVAFKLLVEPKQEEIAQRIQESLPVSDEDRIMAQSLMDIEIAVDRDCHQINLQFCFCEVLQSVEITGHVRQSDVKHTLTIVDSINAVTGNGEWYCDVMDATQFVISLHLENREKDYLQIVIEKFVADEAERERLIAENRLLSFSATFGRDSSKNEEYSLREIKRDGKAMPSITRLDYFKYEECLITAYERGTFRDYDPYFAVKTGFGVDLEPIFKDFDMTRTMLIHARNHSMPWNLRVCHCKV